MPFSFRLDPDTSAKIRRLAQQKGWSQSEVVREAVAEYGEAAPSAPGTSLFDRLQPFMGTVTTDGAQRSTDTHAKYRAFLERKRSRVRRAR